MSCLIGCRLGQADSARKHLCFLGKPSDPMELQKLEAVEKHMSKCADARRLGDWKAALMEVDAAIVAGADFSPQVITQLISDNRVRTGIKCRVLNSVLKIGLDGAAVRLIRSKTK